MEACAAQQKSDPCSDGPLESRREPREGGALPAAASATMRSTIRSAIAASTRAVSRRGLMVLESRIMVVLYAALFALAVYFGFAWVLIVAWIAPRVAGEPIQRIIRVAEHVGCDESPDLLRNTRTTRTNRLVNAIAWQMPYHAEHHLFPNVPFHALPAVHALVADRVVVEPRGYLAGQRQIVRMLLDTDPAARRTGEAHSPLL